MKIEANSIEEYIGNLPEERQIVIEKLREIINQNIPKGFLETMNYGMIGWVVPHSIYSAGYHCDPKLPLPFLSIASQKNFVAVYHMGIYVDSQLYDWFVSEYALQAKSKLDMGKSCMRFKKMDQIPYELIGELCRKTTVEDWIKTYEKNYKKEK